MRNKIANRVLISLFIFFVIISAILVILPLIKLTCVIPWIEKLKGSSVDIGMWIITVLMGLLSIKLRKPVLRHELYCRDRYFVDRTEEREILFAFLEAKNSTDSSLFFVKSGMCRGKTALLRCFADDVNGISKRSTIQRKYQKSKDYSAYYIEIHQSSEDILQEISQALCGSNDLNTYHKATMFLKKSSYRRKTLLLIDNISRMQSRLAIETAHGLLYKNQNLKIILAITEEMTTVKPCTLTPPLFGEMHISELAKVYKITISHEAEQEIIRISNGIPSYVRMIFQSDILEHPITLSNIEDIQKVVENQLSRVNSNNLIANYLACLKLCYDGNISKFDLLMLAKASEAQLEELFDAALAREEIVDSKSYISMDGLVAQCCLKTIHCTEYIRNIYNFYRAKEPNSDIAFAASLMLPDYLQNNQKIQILKRKYEEGKYLVFSKLGTLEEDGRLCALQAEQGLYNTFQYYYLSSLLQLGEYAQAISTLARYERSSIKLPTLRECCTPSGFEMQYLIIDLHHLSNQFTMALGEIEAILSHSPSIKQEYLYRLLYLKSHCLKHLGSQLQEADCILASLAHKELPQHLKIKALYSRLAIHIFWGDPEFDYETVIQHLKKLLREGTPEWVHTIRHLAKYTWWKTGNAADALKIIDTGLETLEITRWRIIYDFYFEKAEWMRIQNTEEKAVIHSESTILNFYEKAITFADENQDINLACCARLGKILTLVAKKGNSDSWCKEQWKIADLEFVKMDKAGLEINKTYAAYIKVLLSNEKLSPIFIHYCRQMGFYDLTQHIENGRPLKFTVM